MKNKFYAKYMKINLYKMMLSRLANIQRGVSYVYSICDTTDLKTSRWCLTLTIYKFNVCKPTLASPSQYHGQVNT